MFGDSYARERWLEVSKKDYDANNIENTSRQVIMLLIRTTLTALKIPMYRNYT